MKHSIATIINFCTNESRFIKANLEQAHLFSKQVIVVVCDHFFDAAPENRILLDQIYAAFPETFFVEYPYIPDKIPKKITKKIDQAHLWHSLSRLIGFTFVDEEIETVLFIDADEIADAKRFIEWLDSSDYQLHTTLKLANYWYFREPSNQALQFEDTIVIAQKKAIDADILLHQDERDAIYKLLPNPKRRHVTAADGKPMFHHFSWVRTREEMLQKVKTWGHKNDRDWTCLVDEEFKGPFMGSDFVHGYRYKIVKPLFEISLQVPHFEPKGLPQLKKLASSEVLKKMKVKNFWNFF